jgi:hypothetical protein
MNKLNKWLTLLANLGVVVGIVFLIIEIRQTNTLMKANAFQDRSSDLIQIGSMAVESEPLSSALSKLNLPNRVCDATNAPLTDLSEQELAVFKQYIMAHLFRLQNLDQQFQHGLIEIEHHVAVLRALQRYTPFAQRLGIPEANIGKVILARYETPIPDAFCGGAR